jgi:hypothetical protein
MLSSLFHVHKSCNLVQSNVDSVSHLLPNSFSRCPRTSFINAEVIVVDDTFVVPPPEVGHSVISSFSSFRVLSVDRIIGDFSKRSDGRFLFLSGLITLAYELVPLPIYRVISDSDWIRSTESHHPFDNLWSNNLA